MFNISVIKVRVTKTRKLELTFAKIQVGHSVYKSRIKSKDEIWVVHLYLALFTDGWEGGAQPLPPSDSGVSR